MTDLKVCPFCGKEPDFDPNYQTVRCWDCTDEMAINKWNTRHEPNIIKSSVDWGTSEEKKTVTILYQKVLSNRSISDPLYSYEEMSRVHNEHILGWIKHEVELV